MKWVWIIMASGAILFLRSRPRQFNPDELNNLFWDEVNGRWRSEAEVADLLREHPEMLPTVILSSEARVLSYLTEIEANAQRLQLDPALIAAIISKESGGDYAARGQVGEYGLMQIRLTTAQMLGFSGDPDSLLNPSVNIRYGSEYLNWQRRRFLGKSDPMSWAVSGYNAGTPEIKGGKFRNQAYVDSVIKNRLPRYRLLIDRAHGIYRSSF